MDTDRICGVRRELYHVVVELSDLHCDITQERISDNPSTNKSADESVDSDEASAVLGESTLTSSYIQK